MSIAPPGKALLSIINVYKDYGAQPVLDGVSMTVHEGDRIGLIGRNGSGKSTLMRLLSGRDVPDNGEVTRAQNLRVTLLAQSCALPETWTVREALDDTTLFRRNLITAYETVLHALAEAPHDGPEHDKLHDESLHLQHQIEAHAAWDIEQDIKRISVSLNLPPADRILSSLSGGELRRVDLAARLLERPDVLLLDEPTNHIDTDSVVWIEQFLEQYTGSCILVTHDRYFLDRVVNRIVEIEFKHVYSFPGSYERFLEYKAGVEDSTARAEDNRQAMIRRELYWFRRGAKARSTKQKARINRLDETLAEGPPPKHRDFTFEIPESRPLSKTILEARRVYFGYDDRELVRDFSFILQKDMRVGIIGPNGAGKTSLLRVLMGQEAPRKGKIIIGDNTDFLYVDQAHEDVLPHQSVLDFVSGGAKNVEVGKRRVYVPAYLEKFLFDKNSVLMPMGNLSGGEKNRLDLLRKLIRGGNVLVLDEPTNDLDLFTLRVLEEMIEDFDGPAIIVSHDRYFINRVCTHMLVFDDDAQVTQITGNYDDYVLYRRRKPAGAAPVAPAAPAVTPQTNSTPPAPKPGKLTYHEKKELDAMEQTIAKAEAEIARLEALINDPAFYGGNRDTVQDTLQLLDTTRASMEALFARWEALDARR
jgi:ATP-binding cassette subfamily F protein uup